MPKLVLASAPARWVRPSGDSSTAVCAIRLWSGADSVATLLREAFARRGDCSLGAAPAGQPLWLQSPALAALLWIGADWGEGELHILLIRDPRVPLAELLPTGPGLRAEDLGLPQQNRLFERVMDRTGQAPAIIDAQCFLLEPEAHLRALCRWLGIDFDARMVIGLRARFAAESCARRSDAPVHGELVTECLAMYQRLYPHRLLPDVRYATSGPAGPH